MYIDQTMYPSAFAPMFTNGGSYYNSKHTSVRLGLLAVFLELDLDTMVVMRTTPTQSSANPVERVMSVLNLGLQGVALVGADRDDCGVRKRIEEVRGHERCHERRRIIWAYGTNRCCERNCRYRPGWRDDL